MINKNLVKRTNTIVSTVDQKLSSLKKYMPKKKEVNIDDLLSQVKKDYNEKKYDDVVNLCKKILLLDETNDKAYSFLESVGYARRDDESAFKFGKKAADLGNVKSSHNTGYNYSKGFGTEQNYEKAVYYYQLAIDRGNFETKFNLSNMYFNGLGVERDISKAINLCSDAGEKGLLLAQLNMGDIYAYGDYGELKDFDKAIYWYKKAVKKNSAKGQYMLAITYQNKRFDTGVHEHEILEEKILLKKAVDQGLAEAISLWNKIN